MTSFYAVVCGNALVQGAVIAPDSDCDMGCGGNATYVDVRNQLSIFKILNLLLGKHVAARTGFQ